MQRVRFDIVVWNYERLPLFVEGFSRIRNADPERDRVTIVSSSPSADERRLAEDLARRTGLRVDYLERANRGLAELPRCEYFTGRLGNPDRLDGVEFVFQMQDHYLAPDAPASKWGADRDFLVKGDACPDDAVFDLDAIEGLLAEGADAVFCDRRRPALIELARGRFIAPNGGNFIIRTSLLQAPESRRAVERLARCCNGTYDWALYAEYMWGIIFFPEGRVVHDLDRRRSYDSWPAEDFYIAPDDYRLLMRMFGRPWIVRTLARLDLPGHRAIARLLARIERL